MANKYCEIIWTQSTDDETVNKFFSEEVSDFELFDHLKCWDYGDEDEHTIHDGIPAGKADTIYEYDDGLYIMTFNMSLAYVGLYRKV
jgi:hypothetical protein